MDSPTAASRWLSGRFSDLFFGCGLFYCVAFAALWLAGPQVRELIPMELSPWIVLLTGVPHYGATLLRVYQRPEDRRRYALFGYGASLLVLLAFVWGVYDLLVGSLLLTLYLTWSPWHYASQNYGIGMMFLRRRGVALTAWSKRLYKWSFVLSFALTFLAFHGAKSGTVYAPGEYELSVYQLIPLGIPNGLVEVLIPLCAGAYATCLIGSAVCFLRVASWRDLVPSAVLVGSQALWFAIPLLARHADLLTDIDPLSAEHAAYAFLWIAAAHAVQYVWITRYYARTSPSPPGRATYLWQTVLAGAAIWVVPALVFAPGVLGNVPFDAGLGALVAAAVNLHHFVLDGAIWKLRDGRIARILLRGQADGQPGGPPRRSGAWLRRAVWTAGLGSVCVLVLGTWERVFGLTQATRHASEALAAGDDDAVRAAVERAEAAERRLRWVGQTSARAHGAIAQIYLQLKDREAGDRHAMAAAALRGDWMTFANLGDYFRRTQQWAEAIETIGEAQRQRPDNAQLASTLAWLLTHHGDGSAGSRQRAVSLGEISVRGEARARWWFVLAQAYQADGHPAEALRAAERAEQRARLERDPQLARFIEYRQSLSNR